MARPAFFAALLASLLTGLAAPAAEAGQRPPPGYGGYYPQPYPDYPPPPYWDRYPPPYWAEEPDEVVVWVTSKQGKEILFNRGYYDVKSDNCRGPNYRYRAWRDGRQFDIRMDSSGNINRVRRLD